MELDPKSTYLIMRENLIVISSIGKILVYRFNSKKKSEGPVLIFREEVGEEVKFIRFPKEQLLAVFYPRHFEVYSFDESLTHMTKVTAKKYGVK